MRKKVAATGLALIGGMGSPSNPLFGHCAALRLAVVVVTVLSATVYILRRNFSEGLYEGGVNYLMRQNGAVRANAKTGFNHVPRARACAVGRGPERVKERGRLC